jgi:hypothetical protein
MGYPRPLFLWGGGGTRASVLLTQGQRLKPLFLVSALLRDLSTFAHTLGECKRRVCELKDFTSLSRRLRLPLGTWCLGANEC